MRGICTLIVGLLLTPAVAAATDCLAGHGLSDAELETLHFTRYRRAHPEHGLTATHVLGEVRYYRQNVFPEREHWLARQANRFNTLTRESTLRYAFPVESGSVVDETLRAEAERLYRDKPFLYDALVLVRRICDDRVDLDVVVRDVWTLTPGFSVSRSGGDNETSVSLSDVNVLGKGKSVSVAYFDDRDRAGAFLEYVDPNLWGSRWTGALLAADNDDGDRYGLTIERPFYALDTQYALGLSGEHFTREQDLEFLGDDLFELDAESNAFSLYAARSDGRQEGWINRYYLGYRFVEESFEFPADFPGPLESERRFSYPFIAWQSIQDQFTQGSDVERVGITEDLKLGWSSYAELGWSTDRLGGEGDFLLLRGSAAYRRFVDDGQLLSLSVGASGRYDLDRRASEDVQLDLQISYLWQQGEKWRFFTSGRYNHTRNLPLDKQLTLGGDSGLRGYPTRYQPGDRSFLVTIEQRYHSGAYPFGLFRVGYAAFVDVGRAWFDDPAPDWVPTREGDHFGTLANVGLGLRLESVRTRRDRVFHIDVSRPLVDGPDVDDWEITLSGKQRF